MNDRRRLTLHDKLEILLRQARCGLCREPIAGERIEWDHVTAIARGGEDSPSNVHAVHVRCHRIKSYGSGATTRGSDIAEIAKTKRLSADEAEFRRRLLIRDVAFLPADHADAARRETQQPAPKRRIPSRPFPKREQP